MLEEMPDTMDVDQSEPRGIKRTADEAGLPPEAPRRIQARHFDSEVSGAEANR